MLLREAIKIPVKVGDTILTGRFKNKKTKVNSIGEDEHGMPTINGRKVVTFRTLKQESNDEQFGVYLQGGSIGDNRDKSPIGGEKFPTRALAQEKAKRMTKALSPGEKKYYKMKYTAKPIKKL